MKKQVSSNVGRMDPQADPREPAIEDRFLEYRPERYVDDLPDRRDFIKEGRSLSGSTKRDNNATQKALHAGDAQQEIPNPAGDIQDQDPGMRQKQNQAGEKDDPLAA